MGKLYEVCHDVEQEPNEGDIDMREHFCRVQMEHRMNWRWSSSRPAINFSSIVRLRSM